MTFPKARILVAAMLASAGFVQAAPVLSYNGSDYYFTTNTAGTWTAGEAEAVGMGGHLVTINDAAEEAALLRNECIRYIFRLERVDRADDGTFTLYTTKDGMGRMMSGVKADLAREIMRLRGWLE